MMLKALVGVWTKNSNDTWSAIRSMVQEYMVRRNKGEIWIKTIDQCFNVTLVWLDVTQSLKSQFICKNEQRFFNIGNYHSKTI